MIKKLSIALTLIATISLRADISDYTSPTYILKRAACVGMRTKQEKVDNLVQAIKSADIDAIKALVDCGTDTDDNAVTTAFQTTRFKDITIKNKVRETLHKNDFKKAQKGK